MDKIPAPGHAPGRVMSRGCAASEPASPPATTWGSGGGGGGGGRNAGSAARCQPEPLQPSAGGSGGASRADLDEEPAQGGCWSRCGDLLGSLVVNQAGTHGSPCLHSLILCPGRVLYDQELQRQEESNEKKDNLNHL